MKVVCVDSCIRSRVFGIDIALRNRFELFKEMKVPYELWVSEADTDIYILTPLLGSLCWTVMKPWALIEPRFVFLA